MSRAQPPRRATLDEKNSELFISDKTVEKIMGPEPIPTLDIELALIENNLQRKMVEEVNCAMCMNFPYQPK